MLRMIGPQLQRGHRLDVRLRVDRVLADANVGVPGIALDHRVGLRVDSLGSPGSIRLARFPQAPECLARWHSLCTPPIRDG
jgi:hypothetical protein